MTPRDQLIEAIARDVSIRDGWLKWGTAIDFGDTPNGNSPDEERASRIAQASDHLSAIEALGYVVMPKEETVEIVNAAIDVDSFKLGDISPLGFRESPQHLFARCYRAMIEAGKI